MREYYVYYLHERHKTIHEDYIFHFQSLFQQWVLDGCLRIDSSRLEYYKSHQKKITREKLSEALKALGTTDTGIQLKAKVGMTYLMPSTFQGSYAHLQNRFQDILAVSRYLGKPDLFITFTCNPDWDEIKSAIKPELGETAYHRPDICVRVFYEKMKLFAKLVCEEEIFGPCAALICVVEFQKRGLPHAHCLVFLDEGYKIHTAEDVDMFITAEIPDKNEDPEFYDLFVL